MPKCNKSIAGGGVCGQFVAAGHSHGTGQCRVSRQSSRRARKAKRSQYTDPLGIVRGQAVAGTGKPKGGEST